MKTKSIIIPFFIFIIVLVIPQNVRAYEFSYTYQGKTLFYNIVNGKAQVTGYGYSNMSGTLVIPSSVTNNGTTYSVTTIGSSAFRGCIGLTSVTIPNSVTSIGSEAFRNCINLTSVTIGNSVTSIGSEAFRNCDGLTSVTIGNSVTSIGNSAFRNCINLTSVTIPNSVTSIGSEAFRNCNGLTSVTIGNSVTSIGNSAFYDCSGLTSVTIPNSVTSIGDSAFRGCNGLSSVTIPNSVTSIGEYAFCVCSGLTSLTIPNSVTSIGKRAFYDCTGLTSVIINADSCTRAGELSYYNNNNSAFAGCTNITNFTFGDSVKVIPSYLCYDMAGLTSVTIPNSVTSIGDGAFSYCSGLTSITIPNSVTSIGSGAFGGCSGLASVTIPNSVTSIGNGAFSYCSGLTSVTIPNSVTSIGNWAFSSCSGLTSVTIPNSVTSIGDMAFNGCSGLTSVTIPNSVTSIGIRTFDGCSGLTSVTIPNSVTSIGNSAFSGCSGLTSITIPNFVTSIGSEAFRNCSGLTEITSLAVVAPSLGYSAFYNVPDSIPVYIPCSSTDSYQQSTWNYFSNFIESSAANIDVQTANSTMGAATIMTYPTCFDSTVVITATANYGYHFTQWNDRNTQNPRTITLTQDTTFTALFDRNQYSVTGVANNSARGTVTGSDTVYYLDTVTLEAIAIDGYYFQKWNDNNTANPRQIVATGNITKTAIFNPNQYSITLSVDTSIHGSCSGGGNYNYLSNRTITATANYGYHFTQWNDGNTQNPRTITLTHDTTFTALFDRNQYSVTGVANNSTRGTVTGSDTVYYLDTVTLEAIAIDGYYFQKWNDNNTANPRQIVATGNITKTAIFNPNQYSITLSVDTSIHGSCSGGGNNNYLSNRTITATANYGYHFTQWNDGNTQNPRTITLTQDTTFTALFDRNQYSVTGVANNSTRGTVTGSDTVYYLDTVTLEAIAIDGYYFQKWNDNNTANPRQIVATGNITKTAIFNPNQYSITLSVDTSIHGSCSGGGNYNYLSNRTITATANYGYHFTQWNDGNTQNPRTITLTQDTTFTAMFAKNIYIVTVVSNDNTRGTVAGNDTVEYLDSITISATANYYYHFTRWQDNNTDNPRRVQVTQNKTYTAYFDFNQYSITLDVDTNIHGAVYGGGSYNYLSNRTIIATPNYGYHFTQWSDGDTNNPRVLTLTQDTAFTALFAKNTYTITAIPNDTIRGIVTGSTLTEYLDSVTITANPNYGYYFTTWNDGNTDNPRTIVATRDSVFTASFGYNQYTITLNVDTDIHGSIAGGGLYNYLSEQTINAIANHGYHFTTWNDGDTTNPRTITLTQDTVFTAIFAKNTYTLTGLSADTIRGSVSGSTTMEYLDSVSIAATANYGYHFLYWNDGETTNPRIITLIQDTVLTAYFAKNWYSVIGTSDNETMGYVTGSDTVEYFDNVSLSATSNYGYHFSSWSDGDTNNPREVRITQDTIFVALFAKNQYILTVQSNDETHGNVSDGGVFDYLDTVIINASANDHYHFVRWDDGNTENPRDYIIVGDATLTAIFAIDTHTVIVASNDIARGMVEATGTEFVYGTPCTVTATVYTGYMFSRWSNGITANPYTFAVLEDTELMAIFEEEGTQGIDDVATTDNIRIFSKYDRILIDGLNSQYVTIYTIDGRTIASLSKATEHIAIPVSMPGVYFVKVGEHPARKVVVIR